MTTECKKHKAVESHDRCYSGGNVEDCPAAAGGITTTEYCACGASRSCHVNQNFWTAWSPWSDSSIDWWVRRNASAIRWSCSDPDLADYWTQLILEATNESSHGAELERIRQKVRRGEEITLYERAA